MGKKNDQEFKSQSYFRLLAFAKPYKARLAIGIISGILTGGSLFGVLSVIPAFALPFQKSAAEMSGIPADAGAVSSPVTQSSVPDAGGGSAKNKTPGELKMLFKAAERIGVKPMDARGEPTKLFVVFFIGALVLFWLLKNLMAFINHYYMRWVGTRIVADLRDLVFRKLVHQSLAFYGKIDIGQLISRCTQDTASIESAVSNVIADAIRCPFEIIACLSYIIYVSNTQGNFTLPVIIVIMAGVIFYPMSRLGRKIREIYRRAYQKIAEVVSRMHEVFTGILIVKAYHAEEKEYQRFREINRRYFKNLISAVKAELLMTPLMEVMGVGAFAAFVIYSYANHLLLSDIVALLAPAYFIYPPIKNLAKVNSYVQRSMAAADRYFNLIDNDTEVKEKPDATSLRDLSKGVSFDNVFFNYGTSERDILRGISFKLGKGQMVAVVGETGSGKTTIANLIARFYDATSGSVSIDGHDVRDLKIADLRDMIGIVTQDAILFNTTIAENIAYGVDNASMDQIIEAAKQANAHQFITDGRHPEGYDTIVGEKGCKLSGGEKQRLAIARSILKNPPILILDEATSALDTVTEKLVQEALNRLMEHRTVFAIAHRLSTIKHANTILVLDKGLLIESGTHDELMAKPDGNYRKLHDTQFDRQS